MSKSNETDELLKEAAELFEKRRYADAEALQKKAVDLLRHDGVRDGRTSRAIENLAGIHFVQGKFELAANEYEEALQIDLEVQPDNHAEIWRVLYWLGLSQFKQRNYEQAESTFRRALSLAETMEDSPSNLAASLHQLGFVLYFVGKYREAEPYLLRALTPYEKTTAAADLSKIDLLTRIALTYQHCPEIGKDPEPYLRRAVDSAKPEGETYQAHIESLSRLGEHVAARGRFDEADELFTRLLSFLRSRGPAKSPSHWVISDCVEYFKSRNKIELVKDFVEAAKNYDGYGEITQDRLNHAEQTLADNDPEFAESLFMSANHLIFHGKYEEAEAQLGRALDSYEKIYGDKSEQVVTALNRLCVARRMLEKIPEAGAAIDRALAIARESFSDRDIYPTTLEKLALLREAEGKSGEAEAIYAQAISETERICGFPSFEALEALYRQSGHLLRAREFGLAETAIRRALSAIDATGELSSYEKSDYFSTLASILEAQGRSAEAKEMSQRAQELFERGDAEASRVDTNEGAP